MTSLYKTPVTNLNGIGEKRAALFARLGIKSVGDLINFYPRTYKDWSNIKHIDELEYGETVCIKAVVCLLYTSYSLENSERRCSCRS